MVYFRPPAQARDYFCETGWKPANRQTTPDFLVAVTDPVVRPAREGVDVHAPPYSLTYLLEIGSQMPDILLKRFQACQRSGRLAVSIRRRCLKCCNGLVLWRPSRDRS
jgi:hypothetical protein